jgi:hypothetical protein
MASWRDDGEAKETMLHRRLWCASCSASDDFVVPAPGADLIATMCRRCQTPLTVRRSRTGQVIVEQSRYEADLRTENFLGPYPVRWTPSRKRAHREYAILFGFSEDEPPDELVGLNHGELIEGSVKFLIVWATEQDRELDGTRCRCPRCRKLIEVVAWSRRVKAGEPPLVGVLVLDVQAAITGAALAEMDEALKRGSGAAAIFRCRRCRQDLLFPLRGRGQAGPAQNLDAVLHGLGQLF